jgi:hypothetical protein
MLTEAPELYTIVYFSLMHLIYHQSVRFHIPRKELSNYLENVTGLMLF